MNFFCEEEEEKKNSGLDKKKENLKKAITRREGQMRKGDQRAAKGIENEKQKSKQLSETKKKV